MIVALTASEILQDKFSLELIGELRVLPLC